MGSSTSTDVEALRSSEVKGEDSVVSSPSAGSAYHLQSMTILLFRLRDVTSRAYEGMGELPLPSHDLIHVMTLMQDRTARLREDKTRISGELAKDGITEPGAEEMETIATYVHYAHLVYEVEETDTIREALRQANCDLISHSTVSGHARAPYFLCFNVRSKQAFLSIRGPPTISDVLMDLVSDVVTLGETRLSHMGDMAAVMTPLTSTSTVYVHKGFAKAAQAIKEETIAVLRHLIASQEYTIVIIGHSMGAGVACCVAKLLHDEGVPVKCYAFGAPPCMDKQAALGMKSYCTSIVNHDDVITRASPYAFKFIGELAKACAKTKNSTGKDATSDEALQVANALTNNPSAVKVDSKKDLYVPGRVLFLYLEDCQLCAAVKDGTLRTLRRLEISRSCLQDHLCEGYIAATQDVAARLAKRSTADYRPWTVQAVFDSGSGSDSSAGTEDCEVAEEEDD